MVDEDFLVGWMLIEGFDEDEEDEEKPKKKEKSKDS